MKSLCNAILSFCAIGVMLLLSSSQVSAHGYVLSPESRAYQCYNGYGNGKEPTNFDCGIRGTSDPQSIEGYKGFPEAGPPDGHIASGNISTYSELDVQTPDRWTKVDMKTGENTFVWYLTMSHTSASWRFFITKADWNQSEALTRAAFDLENSICNPEPISVSGINPPTKENIEFKCYIPTDREGYHVILAIWDVADTNNAFYQVIDVNLSN